MSVIGENSKVTITYQGKLDTGEVFKNIEEKRPLEITIGNGDIPPTLEKAILGLSAGDTTSVRVAPEEGYGARQKILLHTVSRKTLGNKVDPKPGMILSMKIEKDGQEHQVPATIIEVAPESIVIDYNHPLAGHHLTYHIRILQVSDK